MKMMTINHSFNIQVSLFICLSSAGLDFGAILVKPTRRLHETKIPLVVFIHGLCWLFILQKCCAHIFWLQIKTGNRKVVGKCHAVGDLGHLCRCDYLVARSVFTCLCDCCISVSVKTYCLSFIMFSLMFVCSPRWPPLTVPSWVEQHHSWTGSARLRCAHGWDTHTHTHTTLSKTLNKQYFVQKVLGIQSNVLYAYRMSAVVLFVWAYIFNLCEKQTKPFCFLCCKLKHKSS